MDGLTLEWYKLKNRIKGQYIAKINQNPHNQNSNSLQIFPHSNQSSQENFISNASEEQGETKPLRSGKSRFTDFLGMCFLKVDLKPDYRIFGTDFYSFSTSFVDVSEDMEWNAPILEEMENLYTKISDVSGDYLGAQKKLNRILTEQMEI